LRRRGKEGDETTEDDIEDGEKMAEEEDVVVYYPVGR